MKSTATLSEIIQRAFAPVAGGAVRLVDDLLAVCAEHTLQLDWQRNVCRVRTNGGDWVEFAMPLSKSVFRSVLARLAALCNKESANAVSPYGGNSTLSIDAHPGIAFNISFMNTPAEQKLELTTVEPVPAAHRHELEKMPSSIL